MIKKDELKELLSAYGWEEIVSKNKYMWSFIKGDARLNYYFTSGSMTIQQNMKFLYNGKNVYSLLRVEEAVMHYNDVI